MVCAAPNPEWVTPIAPFRIADNLYYVGSKDLASYLVKTPEGDILINSSLPRSVPLIEHSLAQLGVRMSDIKILLISHAHSDHAGGSAAILRATHAQYMVLVAHKTPGHTRGCTTWTMETTDREHNPGRPLRVVIVGSWYVNSSYRLV